MPEKFIPVFRPPGSPLCGALPTDTVCGGDQICGSHCTPVEIAIEQPWPTLYVGHAYNFGSLATTGSLPIAWSATGLPDGLSMASNGVITGTPVTDGEGTATITATNCEGDEEDTLELAWAVEPCTEPTFIDGDDSALSLSPVYGTPYTNLLLTDGSGPGGVWAITSGALPTGLTLNESTGVLSGTPTAYGEFGFYITYTNPCGSTSQEVGWDIAAPTTVRRGTWKGVEAPTFTAANFTDPSTDFEHITNTNPTTRVGAYTFPAADAELDVYLVIWISDALLAGSPSFKILGIPLVLNPGTDLPYQSLTIAGIPGKVFKSFNPVNGGTTVDVL